MNKALFIFISLIILTFATAKRCGEKYGNCENGECCSKFGFCGKSKMYCGNGCQSEYGSCNKIKSDLKEKIIEEIDEAMADDDVVDTDKLIEIEQIIENAVEEEEDISLDSDNEEIEDGDDAVEVEDNNEEDEDIEADDNDSDNEEETIVVTLTVTDGEQSTGTVGDDGDNNDDHNDETVDDDDHNDEDNNDDDNNDETVDDDENNNDDNNDETVDDDDNNDEDNNDEDNNDDVNDDDNNDDDITDCSKPENKDLPECAIDCSKPENKDLPECAIDCNKPENKDLPECAPDCNKPENKDLPQCVPDCGKPENRGLPECSPDCSKPENKDLPECASESSQPTSSGKCTEPFGTASKFNGFFFGDFTGTSSDVQGRLAAKGVVNINGGYQNNAFTYDPVKHKQQSNYKCNESPLKDDFQYAIVAGSIHYKDNGEIANGGVAYLNDLELPNSISESIKNHDCPSEKKSIIDFDAEKQKLIDISKKLASTTSNCKRTIQWGTLTVDLVQGENLCVVNLDSLNNIYTFIINENDVNIDDVTIIFNIENNNVNFTNFDLSTIKKYASKILWNIPYASKVTIQNFRIQGSLLAPTSDIEGINGNIQGIMIGNSFKGNLELDWVPFYGCI